MPVLPTATGRLGRGYGLGWNRARTRQDQLHGGQDFVAPEGTPIRAPIRSVVEFISTNTGPTVTVAQAKTGRVGRVIGLNGYGNVVVLRHDNMTIPGLPATFWTSYNHLSTISPLRVGQRVEEGAVIGLAGRTNNNRFAGMGAHLHFELRRRPYPGSYDRDTVDPDVLWRALGLRNGRAGLGDYEPPPETDQNIDISPQKSDVPIWPIIGGCALLLFVLIGGTRD